MTSRSYVSFAALDANHHPLAIDVREFQVCQFSTPRSGSAERHQQNAMVRSPSCVDELRNFFLAEDRWQAKIPISDKESRQCSRTSSAS
jgi:hypothetical protein